MRMFRMYRMYPEEEKIGGNMLTDTDYAARARAAGYRTYFVAEGDREGNARVQTLVPANPCCNCYSVAKAFTVTAFGMLTDRGLLRPEDKLADVLAPLFPDGCDRRWYDVTLDQLLLHRAGIGIKLDIDAQDARTFPPDYLTYVLRSGLVCDPGTEYHYTDAAFYLLSRVIRAACGKDPAELLRPVCMETMHFGEFAWSVCPGGFCMGATGLYLRTEDLLKLGILYLRGGDWMGTRVISGEWVDTVLSRGYELHDIGGGWYSKGGMRGQRVAFSPEKGLAVAWNSFEKTVDPAVMLA